MWGERGAMGDDEQRMRRVFRVAGGRSGAFGSSAVFPFFFFWRIPHIVACFSSVYSLARSLE